MIKVFTTQLAGVCAEGLRTHTRASRRSTRPISTCCISVRKKLEWAWRRSAENAGWSTAKSRLTVGPNWTSTSAADLTGSISPRWDMDSPCAIVLQNSTVRPPICACYLCPVWALWLQNSLSILFHRGEIWLSVSLISILMVICPGGPGLAGTRMPGSYRS